MVNPADIVLMVTYVVCTEYEYEYIMCSLVGSGEDPDYSGQPEILY